MAEFRDQVSFDKIARSYPTGAHIECSFTMKASHKPNSYDWIGLFKVGWANSKDFVFYHWVPSAKDKGDDEEYQGSVLFQSVTLPKEDHEFYQFVYFNANHKMCGASNPFVFQNPNNEEFIEEVMPDDEDMLYITTRHGQLEETKTENEKLRKTCDAMNEEINNLSDQVKLTEQKLAEAEEEVAALTAKVQQNERGVAARLEAAERACAEKDETNSQMSAEVEHYQALVQQLQEQVTATTADANLQIMSLQKKVEEALPDKEALDTLTAQLAAARDTVASLKKTKQLLKEQKHDLEDKLEAAEARHVVDTTEIGTLNETLVNLSIKTEQVNTELEDLKTKHQRIAAEQKDWETTLEEMGKEKNGLLSTIGELQHKLDQMTKEDTVNASNYENQEDRYFALQTAYGLLRDELREQSKKNIELQKREQACRMKAEMRIQDLQSKIKEGQEEYTKLATQKSKLERRLNKKPVSVDPNLLKRSMSHSSRDELTREELFKMVEQLSDELESRTQKKDRYKDKYLDEKQRAATLRDYYKGEMSKLNGELVLARQNLEKKLTPPVTKVSQRAAPAKPVIPVISSPPRPAPAPIIYPEVLTDEPEAGAIELFPPVHAPPVNRLSGSAERKVKGALEQSLLEDSAARLLLTPLPPPMEPMKAVPLGPKPEALNPQTTSNPRHASVIYPSTQLYSVERRSQAEEVRMPPEHSDSDEDNEGADRFHDASDVPANVDKCFICHKIFDITDTEEMRNAHACEHLDATCIKSEDASIEFYQCPMCREKFLKRELSVDDMQAHVNAHFMMPQ